MFRLLGLHPGEEIGVGAAAALAGPETAPDEAAATRLLDRLAADHLLRSRSPGRYDFHDLLRAYATDLAHTTDPDQQRHTATGRLLDHYLHTAYTANRLLNPHRDPITLTPTNPFAEELKNLVGAINGTETLRITPQWGRHIMAVLEAVEESSRSGREVAVQ